MYPQQEQNQQAQDSMQSAIKLYFTRFIQSYRSEKDLKQSRNPEPTYIRQIKTWFDTGKVCNVIYVKFEELMKHDNQLAETISENFYKYESVLNEALTQFVREIEIQNGIVTDPTQRENKQKYYVAFESGSSGSSNNSQIGIRELKSNRIGRLESLIGTVTRTTQVRPELVVGVFRCKFCDRLSKPIEQQFKYTEPKKCLNMNCDSKSWELDISLSEFADFQQLRVQEDPNTIPPGGMPRSIDIILRNYNVEKAQPGDICKFVGFLCVAPEIVSMLKPGQKTTLTSRNIDTRGNMMEMEGVRGIKGIRQLNYKFMFIASNVIVQNQQYSDVEQFNVGEEQEEEKEQEQDKEIYSTDKVYEKLFRNYGEVEMKQLAQLRQNPRLYQDLADSLFSGIYGHPQIKKAILLQLFGGVHKVTQNKIKIRGDINILIVGDPSTAKSQFLKIVNKFVPRSIYTNGKTTSAAGLTASVVRDDQGNVSIEAGALMLADNGICCIDEFDKMNLSDMTAIHEAMEQQTISIAKAGVHATLNARTSILAAANPLFGRYDKTKNLQKNLNISPPIMSRFDLYFVVCDESNVSMDSNLCDFMIKMHRDKGEAVHKKYKAKTIRFYMSTARRIKPQLNIAAARKLRQCYLKLRENSKVIGGTSYMATVRQLQSMIRMSEALARLHLNLQINQSYVQQAFRLISNSITKLEKADIVVGEDEEPEMKENKIQNIIQQELKKKKEQKKQKTISLSSQVYNDIVASILKLFKQEEKRDMTDSQQIKLTQGNVINYVITLEYEKNNLNTEEQEKNFRKIVRAVIKKMIKSERMLMAEGETLDENERVLKIHPNFSGF